MKIILPLTAIVIGSFVTMHAVDPITNTKWEGANGLVIHFTKSDTVKMIMKDKVVGFAQYKIKDSLITWRDVTVSEATCDTSIRGVYIYRIKEDVLSFRTVSDRCEDRANVLQTLVLIKQE